MPNLKAILAPSAYYHVYNSAVGTDKLFRHEENYSFFLSLYRKYIYPIAHTFSYCLTPNSFEFFLSIKDESAILNQMINLEYPHINDDSKTHEFLLQQFGNFLNAYAKAFNKSHRRNGRLFLESFKRRSLPAQESFTALICDMHRLPVENSLCNNISDWPHSSYKVILNGNYRWIDSPQVLEWFGSQKNYIQQHNLHCTPKI